MNGQDPLMALLNQAAGLWATLSEAQREQMLAYARQVSRLLGRDLPPEAAEGLPALVEQVQAQLQALDGESFTALAERGLGDARVMEAIQTLTRLLDSTK